MKEKCFRCGKRKKLTKHSKIGGHKFPYERICRSCHDKEHHHMVKNRNKGKKYQPGTPRWKKKSK